MEIWREKRGRTCRRWSWGWAKGLEGERREGSEEGLEGGRDTEKNDSQKEDCSMKRGRGQEVRKCANTKVGRWRETSSTEEAKQQASRDAHAHEKAFEMAHKPPSPSC
eukprot:183497-Pleurochrysis_carterae.AAC.1